MLVVVPMVKTVLVVSSVVLAIEMVAVAVQTTFCPTIPNCGAEGETMNCKYGPALVAVATSSQRKTFEGELYKISKVYFCPTTVLVAVTTQLNIWGKI